MRQRLVTRQGLVRSELDAASELAQYCNRHDGLDFPTNLYWLEAHPRLEADQFLFYDEAALIGFASLESGAEAELWGMVHPAHRRQGMGNVLLAGAKQAGRRRGLEHILVSCDTSSAAGQAFITAAGGEYSFSEHEMVWEGTADALLPLPARLRLHRAGQAQTETLVSITAAAFGHAEEQLRPKIAERIEEPNRRFYVAELDGEPIGSVAVAGRNERIYITTFGVRPEHQGRGYGRAILMEVVRRLLAEGHQGIRIEVETHNRAALGLYQSCGFREVRAYAYYRLGL